MELVISVVIGILIVEAYAWLPKISEWLLEWAVQGLRSEDQDRCREEWRSGLDALPNTVIKLVHALSFLGAAHRINADYFESKLGEINTLIEECGHKYSGAVASMHAAKEKLGRTQTLRQELGLPLSDLKARVIEAPNKEAASTLQNAVTVLEDFADTCARAIGRAREFLTVSVDRSTERLNHIKDLMLSASEKCDRVTELLGRRDVSPNTLDSLLAELASDLHTVKKIFDDDKWGDGDSFREHKRIMAAIERACARRPEAS